jgi:hypothetical protein
VRSTRQALLLWQVFVQTIEEHLGHRPSLRGAVNDQIDRTNLE